MNQCLSLNCPATVCDESPSVPLQRLQSPPLLLENCIFTTDPAPHANTQTQTAPHARKHKTQTQHTHEKIQLLGARSGRSLGAWSPAWSPGHHHAHQSTVG